MKNKIQEIMNSEKGPTKIKLTLYIVFFVLVVLFLLASGGFESDINRRRNSVKDEEKKVLSFKEKQEKLLKEDHTYKYTISKSDTIIYDGKIENGEEYGYKDGKEGIIKYRIAGGKTYKITNNTEEEYNNLYDDLDNRYLDVNNIFNLINSSSAMIDRQNKEVIYEYVIEENNYKIYTNEIEIYKINIVTKDGSYTLEFKPLGGNYERKI